MGKNFDKFLLLMWKNWKLQYHRPLQTLIEIAAPIVFSIMLITLRTLAEPEEFPAIAFEPFEAVPAFLQEEIFGGTENNVTDNLTDYDMDNSLSYMWLLYSPSRNTILDRMMEYITPLFGNVTSYKNSKDLEQHADISEESLIFAGIQFDDELYGKTNVPQNITVTLRFPAELRIVFGVYGVWPFNEEHINFNKTDQHSSNYSNYFPHDWNTYILYTPIPIPGARQPFAYVGAFPCYYFEGFLSLQTIITQLLILAQMGIPYEEFPVKLETLFPKLQMQRFPHAAWKDDVLIPHIIPFVGLFVVFSFLYTCMNTVKLITTEKEKQLKEAMKIMGLPNWLHWTSWFIKSLSYLIISAIFIVVLLKVSWYQKTTYSILTFSNPFIFFLFLLLYICATITFCFAVSVFFSKANTAALVASILWISSYFPFMFLAKKTDGVSLTTKLFVSLASNTAMAYGFQMFLMYESVKEGIQWHNVWKPYSPDDSLTLGLIMVMLLIDSLIYMTIALYVEGIYPGEFGTPLPWYFPVTYSYWFGSPKELLLLEDVQQRASRLEFFDQSPDLKPGIQIKNLRKLFGQHIAVKNLSLNIYDDQITALLGHNGAGKTTTISMLTGVIPPTSGTVVIQGYDIRTNMSEVRSNLGLCPQHNILFNDLTVKEHLYFFSKLKGLKKNQVAEEIDKYVKLLQLEEKMNKKSKTLSGGMKRKLCVGIALCGNSKVVLLDEPTAGMDPTARRALWDLLQVQKQGRCILLTTHYMDEADVLGDRIAIMANGELKCCGSSFFLKKKFGTGYQLILVKKANCDPDLVTKLLQKYVPDIEVHRNVGMELVYLLKEENAPVFGDMLAHLEKNFTTLHIQSYGISLTTLEDVFMKVGADSESFNEEYNDHQIKQTGDLHRHTKPVLLRGHKLIKNQIIAMLMKKILYVINTWLLLIIQTIIPVVLVILVVLSERNGVKNEHSDLPKLPIDLNLYEDPITLIQNGDSNPFGKSYYDIMRDHKVINVTDINSTMLDLTTSEPSTVKRDYLVGASFSGEQTYKIIAWFNPNPLHTAPLSLGLVLNAIYKDLLGKDHSITFVNHPLPYSTDSKVEKILYGKDMGFNLSIFISFSMAFVSSFYVVFYIKERVCQSKHLQFASGVNGYIFWTTSFFCDLITFIVTIFALLITLLCFQEEGFSKTDELGRMFLVLFVFGFSVLPLMYIASYLFRIPATGYVRMTLVGVITGIIAYIMVALLKDMDFQHLADGLGWVLFLNPLYSLPTAINNSHTTFLISKACNATVAKCVKYQKPLTLDECWKLACNNSDYPELSDYCCKREQDYFQWEAPGIGKNLLYSLLVGIILFLLLNLYEQNFLSNVTNNIFRGKKITPLPKQENEEDDDVSEENKKIRNTPETELLKNYTLVLKDVTKYYKKFLAVNRLCLGIKQFECFGFLGLNGAGKTSTFKMITGDTNITDGDIWIQGLSVKTQLTDVQKIIGYCPQFDALLGDLTPKQTLIIFGLLRGIAMKQTKQTAEALAQDFDFYQHINKKIKHLSGGNRRKLSTAISLIGAPPIICLDEPTAGMDPVTKRYLWNVLCHVRDSGKCLLFTTHSMEECEALCTKLAIMVNGVFKCLGSLQHLKNKFAAGYILIIKLKRTEKTQTEKNFKNVEKFVKENFRTAKQQERYEEMIKYYIVDKIACSKMFRIMEEAKHRLNIEDYALGQADLEQIFLTLTSQQR